ncbi:MAG: PqqD family protein, partial [Planctomycetota bacterium]
SGLVIDSKNGCAYEVTETVCSILKLLKNSKTFNSLLEDILNEYEVDEETARKDLEEILTELVKCKIIEKV